MDEDARTVEKAELRRRMRAWRRSLDPLLVERWSAAIRRHLAGLAAWEEARTVALFQSLPREVQVRELDTGGRRVAWPTVEGAGRPLALREGPCDTPGLWGIPQPASTATLVPPEAVEVVVIPALALDLAGGRLGYGGGFYDRTLADMKALRVAVAFGGQVVDRVPVTARDARMDCVVTEAGVRWTA